MTVLINRRGDIGPATEPAVATSSTSGTAIAVSSTRLAWLTAVSLVALLPSACAFSSGLPRFCATTATGRCRATAATVTRSDGWIRPRAHDSTSPASQQRLTNRVSLLMSYDGGDFPSDVGDGVEEAISVAEDNPELRESMKREILTIAATSNRGQVATQEERDAVMDLVYQLEARNPMPDATNVNSVGGVWELVYSDTQPFRSSPFFMAIGELFGEERQRAETLFELHRAATSNGEIGRVRQTISESTLVSEIDLKVGVLPGIPVALRGTVVTKAKLTPVSPDSFNVAVEGTRVTNNNILSFLDDGVELPLQKIYTSLRGSVPESKLSTYYLDENMRISRTPDDHVFVYVKAV